jgi:WD40 repeat protein/uncharacterized caspase-like protein
MIRKLTFIVLSLFAANAYSQEQPRLMLPIGHTAGVTSAAFSPDGKEIATASNDNTAKIWDAETGILLANLAGHTLSVSSVKFSPDGKHVLTSSWDNTIKIWDADKGTLLLNLAGHTDEVSETIPHPPSAVFSPDGKKILTKSLDYTAKIWDAKNGKLLIDLVGHDDYIHTAIFSSDGSKVITASVRNTVKIWNALTGDVIQSLKGQTAHTNSVAVSPNGSTIVTTFDGDTAKTWNIKTGVCARKLKGHTGEVVSAEFSPNGKWILTTALDHSAKIWNAETGQLTETISKQDHPINSASFSTDGKKIITTSGDKVGIWEVANKKLVAESQGHAKDVTPLVWTPLSAVLSPDGKKILTASCQDKSAKVWNAESGELLLNLAGRASEVGAGVFSPGGKNIVTVNGKLAKVWDIEKGRLLTNLSGHTDQITSLVYSPDGKKIVTGSNDKTVKIWNASTGELSITLQAQLETWYPMPGNPQVKLAYSADGVNIATVSDDTIKIWNVLTGGLRTELNGHTSDITSVAFSPDGLKVLSSSADETARVWDAQTGTLLETLKGHKSTVASAVFSLDGKKIATAGWDGITKIWNAATGSTIAELSDPDMIATSTMLIPSPTAEFSTNGKKIVTTSGNNTAKLWNAETGKLLSALTVSSADYVYTAAFSPNDKLIVTTSTDNRAQIWNAETGSLIFNLSAHTAKITSAAFSPDGKTVLTASLDSKSVLWDINSGKALYTLISIDEDDYLIYDEYYHYDGTENARRLLYFTCGLEVIALDQVKDQLWVPNLAERIMRGEVINAPKLSELDLCFLTPEVEEQVSPRGEYHFKIIPRNGGLGETVVYVNGIEVRRLEIQDLVKLGGYEYLLKIKQPDVEAFFISGQENKVTVRAFTIKNDIGSRGVTVESVSEKNTEPPALHAVIVGVSDYKGDALDLKFAAKDARDFGKALKASASKLFNFDGTDRINLYSVHTENDRNHFPDKNSIKKIFESIGTKAKPNDVLLIFFAGHGVMNPIDQQFYFLTADASAMANPETTGISTKELFSWIQPANVKAQKRVLILDACNSGQAIKDIVKLGDQPQQYLASRSDEQGRFIKAIDKLNERSGLFILSASASDQSAYEMGRYNQGVLTYSLLKSIKEDPTIVDNHQFLNLSQWFEATEKIVEEIATASGARQSPQIVRTTNFPIGIVDDDVRSKIILPHEKPMFSNCNFQDEDLMTDNLGLNKLLDAELSDLSARSADSPITFYPGSTSNEAYQLSGRYTVAGNDVSLKIVVRHKNEIKQRLELKGKKDQMTALAKQVVEEALKLIR